MRNSRAHTTAFDCIQRDRTVSSDGAVQQQIRKSPVRTAHPCTVETTDSCDLRPSLHLDVLRLLELRGLSVDFFEVDDLQGSIEE